MSAELKHGTYISVRIPDETNQRLEDYINKYPIEITRSAVLRAALDEYLARHE